MAGDGPMPVWLLDVDGVLNAPAAGWGRRARHGQLRAQFGFALDLFWAEETVAFVRAVHADGLAEVRWATSWVGRTDLLEQLWGLPRLPLAFDATCESPADEKLRAALEVVEIERRPLVWTDDAEIPRVGRVRDRLTAAGPAALLVSPDPSLGLRAGDVELVSSFLHACDPDEPSPGDWPGLAENVAACARAFGDRDARTLDAWRSLAEHHEQDGRPERAVRAREQLVRALRRILGPDHPETLRDQYALATDLVLMGDVETATTILVDTLASCDRCLGPRDWLTIVVRDSLADLADGWT